MAHHTTALLVAVLALTGCKAVEVEDGKITHEYILPCVDGYLIKPVTGEWITNLETGEAIACEENI